MAPAHRTSYGSFSVSFSCPTRSSCSSFHLQAPRTTRSNRLPRSKIGDNLSREHPDFLSVVPSFSSSFSSFLDHFSSQLFSIFPSVIVTKGSRNDRIYARSVRLFDVRVEGGKKRETEFIGWSNIGCQIGTKYLEGAQSR